MRCLLFCAIIILNSANLLLSQAYLWPTNASRLLSSTFGEYRRDHFHAGIDIKTPQIGAEVYAVADGYIWKIRTNYFGYGKVIYQRLADGNYAIYAHLDGFNAKLQEAIEAEQQRQRRYAVEVIFPPQAMPVSRGELIGYTGDSGTLSPHLHFEIRDSNEAVLNPLINFFQIVDNVAPLFTGLAISPVGLDGRVEGQPFLRTYPVRKLKTSQYIIRDTIQVTGTIGLEIGVYDQADGVTNRYAPYAVRLFVDDTLCYQVLQNRFAFTESQLSEIEYNYQLDQENGRAYLRLWTFSPQRTIEGKVHLNHGVLNLAKGNHLVRIEAEDINGNRSTLTFTLKWVPERKLSLIGRAMEDETYLFKLSRPTEKITSWRLDWSTFYGNVSRPLNRWQLDQLDDTILIRIAEPPQRGEVVRLMAIDEDGGRFEPLWIDLKPRTNGLPSFQMGFIHNPKTFLVQLVFKTPPPDSLRFFLQTSADFYELPALWTSPTEVVSRPVPFSLWQKAFALEIRLATQPLTITRLRLDLQGAQPGLATRLISEDQLLQVDIPPSAVYDTLLLWWGSSEPVLPSGATLISAFYHLYPTNQPLADMVKLNYRLGFLAENSPQLGICRQRNGSWIWLSTSYDQATGILQAQARRLGTFAVLRDSHPPVVKDVFPGDGGRYRASAVKILKARVSDNLSGIPSDQAIKVHLDGEPLIVEYDAVQRKIFFRLKSKLSRGSHTLHIEVRDQAQNLAVIKSNFTILPD
jgi:hypothetical protein